MTTAELVVLIILILAGIALVIATASGFIIGRSRTTNVIASAICLAAHGSIDISTLCCCLQSGTPTNLRYVPTLDGVVGPQPVPYQEVCHLYCSTILPTGGCSNAQENNRYDQCVATIKPNDCSDVARPVAHLGRQPFYLQNPGMSNCARSIVCNQLPQPGYPTLQCPPAQ